MLLIRRAKSPNLKGGFDVQLGPCTLLLGDNGSGKTSIVNAIEYACTKVVSDVRGRALAADAAGLKSLGAPGASGDDSAEPAARKAPHVELELANWDATKGAASGPSIKISSDGKSAAFPDVMILREVEAAIAGSADTLRKFLVKHAVGELSREDVLDRLPAGQRAPYTDATKSAADSGALDVESLGTDAPAIVDELATLVAVGAEAAARARKAAADAKAARAMIDAAPQGTRPTSADGEAALARVRDATSTLERLNQEAGAAVMKLRVAALALEERGRARAARHKTRVEVGAALNAIYARAPELRERVWKDTPAPVAFSDVFHRNMASLRQHVADGAEKCLVCGTKAGHDALSQRLKLVEAKIVEREWYTACETLARLDEDERAAAAEGSSASAAGAGGDAPRVDVDSLATARRVLQEAQAASSVLAASALAWDTVDRARARLVECEARETSAKALASACSDVLKQLFAAGRARFAAKVQAALPAGDKFELVLSDTRIDFGLVGADGALDTALSGGEWARVIGAMALACAGESANTDVPRVLVLPDRQISPRTLAALMEAWASWPARSGGVQIIVCSVVPPEREVPGWTVIRTDDYTPLVMPAAPGARRVAPTARAEPVIDDL